MKLDKTKPYGTVHGGGFVHYEQDGKLFDIAENEIDINGNPIIEEPKKRKAVNNETSDATI